ncbi:MAG TPA: hypothetical protein VIY29_06600, partial [Ktedonobacteraceae bacterium]
EQIPGMRHDTRMCGTVLILLRHLIRAGIIKSDRHRYSTAKRLKWLCAPKKLVATWRKVHGRISPHYWRIADEFAIQVELAP